MWNDPPPPIASLRDMLTACPTFASSIGNAAMCHYPTLEGADSPVPTALPAALLFPEAMEAQRPMLGVSIPAGTLRVVLFLPYDGATSLEGIAHRIAAELGAQYTGLPLGRIAVGPASDPRPGARAASEEAADPSSSPTEWAFSTITLTIPYGLNA